MPVLLICERLETLRDVVVTGGVVFQRKKTIAVLLEPVVLLKSAQSVGRVVIAACIRKERAAARWPYFRCPSCCYGAHRHRSPSD